jgi:effector-binding domain-containing protein
MAIAKEEKALQLTTRAETVNWPETHYVFIEKVGPFAETAPKSWEELHAKMAAIKENNTVERYFSLYKVGPQVYRAGVSTKDAPVKLPDGLRYEKFAGGKYAKYVYTGSYTGLGRASGHVFELAKEQKLPIREGFNIENYANSPKETPEDQLITEIMFPMD